MDEPPLYPKSADSQRTDHEATSRRPNWSRSTVWAVIVVVVLVAVMVGLHLGGVAPH